MSRFVLSQLLFFVCILVSFSFVWSNDSFRQSKARTTGKLVYFNRSPEERNVAKFLGLSGSYNRLYLDPTEDDLIIEAFGLNSSCNLYNDLKKIYNYYLNISFIDLHVKKSKLGNFECGLPTEFNGKLEYLHFDDSEINIVSALKSIKKSGFLFTTVKIFSFNKMNLTEITENFFIDIAELQILDLTNNSIEKIDEKSFKPFANSLKHINLSHNKLKSLPKALMNLKNISEIYINDNPIDQDSSETVQVLDQLSPSVVVEMEIENCRCNLTSSDFFKTVKSKKLFSIYCKNIPSLVNRKIQTLTQKDLCPTE